MRNSVSAFKLEPGTVLIQEQTIRSLVECEGIGLHSGAPVKLRILPAPANTGIIFRRVDLEGFEVEAVGRNVARVSYATSLMKKGVLISTTEHLLSALVGMRIDNAIVELDNLELPILDGSARPFVELIRKAGIRKQRRPRTYTRIVRHKILDLIGDLALIGKQVLGKVVADRAGHAMHTALVSRLLRDRTLWEETTIAEESHDEYINSEMPAEHVL